MHIPSTKTFVPLYFFPDLEDPEFGDHKISLVNSKGGILITNDNYSDLLKKGLGNIGHLTIWIMNDTSAAKGAEMAIDAAAQDVFAAMSTTGENGCGLFLRENLSSAKFDIEVVEKRTHCVTLTDEVIGSWMVSEEEYCSLKEKYEDGHLYTKRFLENVVREVASLDRSDVVHELQLSLEHIPGAYVSFATQDLGTLADGLGIEFSDKLTAQAYLTSAAADFDSGSVMDAVGDAAYKKVKQFFVEDDEEDEPVSPAP